MANRKEDEHSTDPFDMDTILAEIGNFGKFQKWVYLWICIVIAIDSQGGLAYVFTAADLNYR